MVFKFKVYDDGTVTCIALTSEVVNMDNYI